MVFRWRWPLILFALVLGGGPLLAASTKEQRAYAIAVADFRYEMWSRAETEFGQFVSKYKESTNAPMALLLEAQAQFKQDKFTNAIALLADASHLAKAGMLADQYVYWIGEAQFQNADLTNATETFVSLARNYPESPLRLRAAVEAAAACARLDDWRRHDALLEDTNGVFQRAAQLDPGNELVVDGQMSLENSKHQQRDASGVSAVYGLLINQWQALNQDQRCQCTHLFYQAKMELGDFAAALAAATNLVQIASSPTNQDWLATAWSSQGAALEQLDHLREAVQAWQNNLTNAPPALEREAILKTAELKILQGQLTDAGERLTNFLARFPEAISADIARLTVGELHLKNYAAQQSATNELSAAQTNFAQFLSEFTNSSLAGKAYLYRGWCEWLADDVTRGLPDFKAAAKLLPPSEDQAVARFKMGDAQFALNDFADATNSYQAVLDNFTNFPAVARTLGDRALYQMVRANLELTNMDGANSAMDRLLKLDPASDLADSSVMLVGEGLANARKPEDARAVFRQFLAQFPDSPLRPDVEFAIVRTYELEQNWPAAIAGYQDWLNKFPTNLSRPKAVYALALANSETRNETNAFCLFTNFVAQFPTNDELTPLAQWWMADYFFGTGTNYADAEKNYELVSQNFPTNDLAWEACLMAGRAAMARLGYSDARKHFAELTGDTNCPMDLRVQATFADGDALIRMDSADTNNPLANFQQAAKEFNQICLLSRTNEAGALAFCKIGDCELQLTNYDAATNAFAQVFNNTNTAANVSLRSRAQIGFGLALEKKAALASDDGQNALLKMALENYRDVFDGRFGKNLHEGETADPFWVKKAGLAAARLEESFQEWPQALDLYRNMTNAWPSLQATLKNKIETIGREHLEAGKK